MKKKRAKTGAAEVSSVSSAKKPAGKARRAKGAEEEAFFRPFTGLAIPKKGEAADKKRAGKSAAEPKGAAKAAAQPAKEMKPAPTAAPEPSEAETFAAFMAGVRALDKERTRRIPKSDNALPRSPETPAITADLDAPARASMRSLVSEGLRFESTDDGDRLEGRRVDVDPRELRRLRRGQFAIDGKLDLHGMGLTEAREAVTAFVRKRSAEGDRAVAIIHGKGTHSPRGVAVLRGEIGAWLCDGRAARHVLAFATAPDEHGGTGALLVLLAR